MAAYYNKIDPYAAQRLRNLTAAGRILPGDAHERRIEDVYFDDLRSYTVPWRARVTYASIGIFSRAIFG